MDLAEQVHAEGWHQPLALGLHRSDYMLETAGSEEEAGEGMRALQIELNTIAAGFGTLSGCVSGLHARMVSRYGFDHPTVAAALLGEGGLAAAAGVTLPPNAPAKSMAQALAAAHSAYGGSKCVHLVCRLTACAACTAPHASFTERQCCSSHSPGSGMCLISWAWRMRCGRTMVCGLCGAP